MGTLHQEIVDGLSEMMVDLGSPTFVWATDGATYPCIASVSQFTRNLEVGGFSTDKLLTMTVPRYDSTGNPTFPSDVIPQPQQKVTFNGDQFRIESVKQDAIFDHDSNNNQTTNTGARIRIVGVNTSRGI